MTLAKPSVAALGLLCLLFSLTAPFAVPIALLFTKREDKDIAWSWYDTPDEPDLYDLDMETVRKVYERFGHWIAAWYWFGFRNRAHGFESLFAREAPAHWPQGDDTFERDDFFLTRKRFGDFLFVFGWQVYASRKFTSGLEYRPKLAIKRRRRI